MSTYSQYHDQIVQLLDSLDTDPVGGPTRLRWYRDLVLMFTVEASRRRNRLAYELRQQHSAIGLQDLSGINRQRIEKWAEKHRDRTGAPALSKRIKRDVSRAVDLSTGGRFPTSRPR